jgi:alkanesulfonate monooxygenase SsuD/methylene tetrahydromethanopterin reductase-like flavin-dependent oxidoreductase (luciferase family)
MAVTVASAAPGRLTVAIGSGDEMSRRENEAFGIPYYEGADRIEQFESAARVLREFFDKDEITVQDKFVSIDRLPVSPRPASKPKLWVAGRSDDALEIAGTYADGWNGWAGTPERFAQDALRATEFAASAGDRAVELTWGGLAILGSDDDEALAKLGSRNPNQYLVGGPETIARHLGEIVEAGARHLVLTFPDAGKTGTYELLAARVKPILDAG